MFSDVPTFSRIFQKKWIFKKLGIFQKKCGISLDMKGYIRKTEMNIIRDIRNG
jgi:hypothetical protein